MYSLRFAHVEVSLQKMRRPHFNDPKCARFDFTKAEIGLLPHLKKVQEKKRKKELRIGLQQGRQKLVKYRKSPSAVVEYDCELQDSKSIDPDRSCINCYFQG